MSRAPASPQASRTVPRSAVTDVVSEPGRPLEQAVRAEMEPRFRHDFGRVRVHADERAAQSARDLDAVAYTLGNRIVFGAGRFAPQTPSGRWLLAHELAHVVQQGAHDPSTSGRITIGERGDAWEAQADRAAGSAIRGAGPVAVTRGGARGVQRQGAPGSALEFGGLLLEDLLPLLRVVLGGAEEIASTNPKLVQVAQQALIISGDIYAARRRVEITADLSEASGAGLAAERTTLAGRMSAIRAALVALGVPADAIDLRPLGQTSTSAHGQISVAVRAPSKAPTPLLAPHPGPLATPGTVPQPGPRTAPAPASPSLSDSLTVKFGPVTIELPKSIKAKLPVALSGGKTLAIELAAEAPAKFSFNLSLDGTSAVRVSVSAGAEFDKDSKAATGSAGLKIETRKTVCHAADPDAAKAKITAGGRKIVTAAASLNSTPPPDADAKLKALTDIAGAIADMYDAVDKSTEGCKQVPAASLEFGAKVPLKDPTDPNTPKVPPFVGGTLTIPF